jgi:DNA polymerase III subunit gamma/tau
MHTALYRKKRPRTFKEIVGQEHIVRALVNQLASQQVSHAYLFCGTRGTGKTSAAKIFARAVNCFSPQESEPCNECEMCKNILAERSLDVAEIDAASNNGVENIRDLRDEVKYLPSLGKYKVYIIDEVHMLSTSAFNALLKTLEEPPAHVIFILATTDPQKIPATILSRCQRYDFRRISATDMFSALKKILQHENISFEEAALDYIIYHSDGAMRDALSLLDQCLSVGDESLALERVYDLLGAVDRARLFEFTDALAQKDSREVMKIISRAMDDGRDVAQFAADLVRHFRDVIVAGFNADEFSSAEKLKEQSARVDVELLMKFINAFSEALREMRFAPHMRTAFEVCALKLCAECAGRTADIEEPSRQEKRHHERAGRAPDFEEPSRQEKQRHEDVSSQEIKKPTQEKNFSAPSDYKNKWQMFCKKLPASIRFMCAQCGVEEINGMLKLFCGDETTRAVLDGKTAVIRETLADYFGLTTPPNLAIEVREAYNKKEEKPENDWSSLGQVTVDNEEW